jgi:hypothetical protein
MNQRLILRDAQQSARLILGAINASQPDIVVTGASIGKFNTLDNREYVQLIERLNCPVIIMSSFTIPSVNKIKNCSYEIIWQIESLLRFSFTL